MKKITETFSFFVFMQIFLMANPIDSTPVAQFYKLIYSNNEWSMQIGSPFYPENTGIDSVVLKSSRASARLNATSIFANQYIVITQDSLSMPFDINWDGDKITIITYLGMNGYKMIREDSILFGNYPGASVGAPVNGYSIIRIKSFLYNGGYLTIDCLAKNASSQPTDSLSSIGCTMQGHIYDVNNKLIKNYIDNYSIKGIFTLETKLVLDSLGTYTTTVFNTNYKPDRLYVNLYNSWLWSTALRIKPLELNDLEQGTTIYRDIYLADTCKYCNNVTSVNKVEPPKNEDLTLINYPNPFNPVTNFYIKVPDRLKDKTTRIHIYTVTGQLVKSIECKNKTTVTWNAKDENGNSMSSGIYYYSLNIDNHLLKTGSMILLK